MCKKLTYLILGLLVGAAVTRVEAQETFSIRIVRADSPTSLVDAKVTAFSEGYRLDAKETINGIATFELPGCENLIFFRVDPIPTILFEAPGDVQCDKSAQPQEILVKLSSSFAFISTADTGLYSVLANRADTAQYYKDYVAALESGDFGRASRFAGNISWITRDTANGQIFSTASIETGFLALGIDPYSANAPLLVEDVARNGIRVMPPEAEELILGWQRQRGLDTNIAWSAGAQNEVARLIAGNAPFARGDFIVLNSYEDLNRIGVDNLGRFTLRP